MAPPRTPRDPLRSTSDFFLRDYPSTLFPLRLNQVIVEKYSTEVSAYIRREILARNKGKEVGSFIPQHRVSAPKRRWFQRRTIKLDPVAEFFIYDIVYRNRKHFRRVPQRGREVHGFVVERNELLSTVRAYGSFKGSVARYRHQYRYHAYVDVASYFNHVYHHDLVEWFEDIRAPQKDVLALGKFLREIAAPRSIDCLPQGLYPTKMIGSAFLSFIEADHRLRCAQTVRLMDDIWLFDNDQQRLVDDFLLIQQLMGDKGLSLNDGKSRLFEHAIDSDLPTDIDEMKVHLLRKRRAELEDTEYGDDNDKDKGEHMDEGDSENPDLLGPLSPDEQEYLLDLLRSPRVQEEDAELVLTLMAEEPRLLVQHLPLILREFPALTRRVYHLCKGIRHKALLTDMIVAHLQSTPYVPEYQMFWYGMIAEDYLLDTRDAGKLLMLLHEKGTLISRAKILEIPDKRFGLPALREERLRSGASGWLEWCAAFGSRSQAKGRRNQLLKYFRKASSMNRIIGEFVETCFS